MSKYLNGLYEMSCFYTSNKVGSYRDMLEQSKGKVKVARTLWQIGGELYKCRAKS